MPVDKARYPANWREISDSIKARSEGRCECQGECGLHHGRRCEERHGDPARWARGNVVLTVHHLDFDTTNSDPANLRACCQRCHLRCDLPHHRRNASTTRARRLAAGSGTLPGMEVAA